MGGRGKQVPQGAWQEQDALCELQLNLCWSGDRRHGSRRDRGNTSGDTEWILNLFGEHLETNRITCLGISSKHSAEYKNVF